MKIKETLLRDPATHPLVNQGQARIADRATDREVKELQGELATFVCEGQYAEGMQRILSSFLTGQSMTSQKGAWVSGFFGSGKSHLLKMLCHLWQDTEFPDGSTARSLVPTLPREVRELLHELDTAGKRSGGLLAAAGALPGGTTDNVRLTVLSVLLRGAGFPEQYAQARFVLWLHERGMLDQVRTAVEKAGKDWSAELNNLYVSGVIAKAVMAGDPHFATSEAEARKSIREQFKQPSSDLTTAEFLSIVRQVLALKGKNGKYPCTALILDEVQQYIGSSPERSTLVTEVAEALSKQLDGQVIVIGAGQSALSEQQLLHKLLDRFSVRVQLSDTDVETVTRKVLLQKKPSAVSTVKKVLEDHQGEIARQLNDTQISTRTEDQETAVEDYPLLPVRRRFWEQVFRSVDLAGTHSQLRSQLRIIHDAVAKTGDRPLGAVVPADELYDALAPEMVNTGVLLRELNERIVYLGVDGKEASRLRQGLCGLIFLIGRLPREGGADIGVRASATHLADLLVDDLSVNSGPLRDKVQAALKTLVDDGALMQLSDEYRLQTREGADWDKEYNNVRTKLNNDDVELQTERDRYLYGGVSRVLDGIRMLQGKAKELRRLSVSRESTPPEQAGEGLTVWIRDGWSTTKKGFVDEARRAGATGALIYVFIPKKDDADLRQAVVDAMATDRTLGKKGHPSSPEGIEARRSMESRLAAALQRREQVIRRIVENVEVFQGGGNERMEATLDDKLHAATAASLDRLFPRFSDGDAPATQWDSAMKRSREGADQPFSPVGYVGPIEAHPVCNQVMSTVGSGKTGTELRKVLRASPYGWPQDAIDAALIALHRSQHLSATLNGQGIAPGQLDQNRIAKSAFRLEQVILSVEDRLKVRSVFKSADVTVNPGEELECASEFISALEHLQQGASGEPPLPAFTALALIDDLKSRSGNDMLKLVKDHANALKAWIEEAKQGATLAAERLPIWRVAERLARYAVAIDGAGEVLAQLDAVRSERMLLDTSDRVTPLRIQLATTLRVALADVNDRRRTAYECGIATLDASAAWKELSDTDQVRILADVWLAAPPSESVGTDEALLRAMDSQSLGARASEADAVSGRVQRALELAARLLEPKLHAVAVERATLRTDAEVRAWLERQETLLMVEVKKGPVLIN
ncbi:MAG: BREX system P-loop protein BrxC [Acidobacteriota bacterium]|nr:BREX system P-loop protein BrxC [Acidobacteriota bacterium]